MAGFRDRVWGLLQEALKASVGETLRVRVKGSTGHGILKHAAEEKRYGPSGAVTAE